MPTLGNHHIAKDCSLAAFAGIASTVQDLDLSCTAEDMLVIIASMQSKLHFNHSIAAVDYSTTTAIAAAGNSIDCSAGSNNDCGATCGACCYIAGFDAPFRRIAFSANNFPHDPNHYCHHLHQCRVE